MDLKLFVATKAIIERDGKVLILRESGRYKDGTNAGSYDIIGGRIEPGEHLEDALRREIKEETGLEVDIKEFFFVDETSPRPVVRGEEWQIVKIYFRCLAKDGDVRLSEDHDDYKWIDPKEHAAADLIANNHPVFEAYLRHLSR